MSFYSLSNFQPNHLTYNINFLRVLCCDNANLASKKANIPHFLQKITKVTSNFIASAPGVHKRHLIKMFFDQSGAKNMRQRKNSNRMPKFFLYYRCLFIGHNLTYRPELSSFFPTSCPGFKSLIQAFLCLVAVVK